LRIRFFACIALLFYHAHAWSQVFCGIGMTFSVDTAGGILYPKIESIIPNSPAARAGLKPGMFIKGVNGQNTENRRNDEILFMIKGDEDTPVDIYFANAKYERPAKVRIMRGLITKESGDVLADFYTIAEAAAKELEKDNYKIVSVTKASCENKDIVFTAESGRDYFAKVYLLDIFNFSGAEACSITAELSDETGKNTVVLTKRDPLKIAGIDFDQLFLEATFQSKHKEVLHLKSHKQESPTTCREALVVIYCK